MVCASCGWTVSALFWGLGAHHLASLTNLDKITLQSRLRIMYFTIIWLESLNFTTNRLYCVFCPCKRCMETDSLVVRACLESFVPVCDRKRALWQITDASFSAHVAWSLFDLVPRCVYLLWWLACVCAFVCGEGGGPAAVKTCIIWFKVKIRTNKWKWKQSKEYHSSTVPFEI